MMQLVTVIFLVTAQIGPSIGDHADHAGGGPDGRNINLLPPKIPDCRTDEEIRQALAEKAHGDPQSCDPPKSARQAQGR